MLLARVDGKTGKLTLDETFREKGSTEPGISFDRPEWPHGRSGRAVPHGAVFAIP